MIRKGDIYFIRPYYANPRKSGRPAVVISGNEVNKESDSVIVVFMSATANAMLDPHGVCIKSLGNRSYAIASKPSTITKDRLSHQRAGHTTPEELNRLESALCRVLEL